MNFEKWFPEIDLSSRFRAHKPKVDIETGVVSLEGKPVFKLQNTTGWGRGQILNFSEHEAAHDRVDTALANPQALTQAQIDRLKDDSETIAATNSFMAKEYQGVHIAEIIPGTKVEILR